MTKEKGIPKPQLHEMREKVKEVDKERTKKRKIEKEKKID